MRFFMDFLRGDTLAYAFGIRLSQVISIGIFACGVIIYIALWGVNRQKQLYGRT